MEWLYYRGFYLSSTCRLKRIVIIVFCCCVIFACLTIIILSINLKNGYVSPHNWSKESFKVHTKKILYWNSYFYFTHYKFGRGRQPFIRSGCKVDTCEIWHRKDGVLDLLYEEYDAVIFHGINADGESVFRYEPPVRLSHQRYVFFLKEAPVKRHIPRVHFTKNFFNWTATYLRDSDIYFPYGTIVSKDNKDTSHTSSKMFTKWREPDFYNMSIPNSIKTKTKFAAWFVSNWNTQSQRYFYANELAKYIPIDIFGKRHNRSCIRNSNKCHLMVERTYKFYLSFENSLCNEYVTEKFYRALRMNVVPVVYGGANYSAIAPPMSYINVKDFLNPEDLARYLIYLDKNPKEYEKYFWWKSYYNVYGHGYQLVWCNLCEMLHNPDLPKKYYHDINSFWNYPGVCSKPADVFKKEKPTGEI